MVHAKAAASHTYLSAHVGQGRGREHTGQHAQGLAGFLGLLLTHGLLEDASQPHALALLGLEVALRPVMQPPTKPVACSISTSWSTETKVHSAGMQADNCNACVTLQNLAADAVSRIRPRPHAWVSLVLAWNHDISSWCQTA